MYLEHLVYRCCPGRLPALIARFETVTLGFFKKHEMRPAGFFTTVIGESKQELTYMLVWDSLDEREAKWAAFMADPEWIEALRESEKDGRIVANASNQIFRPLPFSPSLLFDAAHKQPD